MNFGLIPFVVLWIVLASAVIVLIVRRKMVASHEDDTIHVSLDQPVNDQVALATKLEQIDKWGKLLTVITVALGLLVAAAYVYQFWVNSATTNPGA